VGGTGPGSFRPTTSETVSLNLCPKVEEGGAEKQRVPGSRQERDFDLPMAGLTRYRSHSYPQADEARRAWVRLTN
jgi:hypothetical protein